MFLRQRSDSTMAELAKAIVEKKQVSKYYRVVMLCVILESHICCLYVQRRFPGF
jgi:hypothetical protein